MKKKFVAAAFLLTLTLNAASADSLSRNRSQGGPAYVKVNPVTVPLNILREISSRYSGYDLAEAFRSEKEYRILLKKEGRQVKACYKITGEFLRQEPR